MIRVLLADEHVVFRQALSRMVSDETDVCVVAETGIGEDLLEWIRLSPCDVCVLEPFMPVSGGIDLLRLLHHQWPDLPVLVLSSQSEQKYAVRSIRAGARGYLCKTVNAATVLDGMRRVAAGKLVLDHGLTRELALAMLTAGGQDPHTHLSDRERHVFGRLVAGDLVGRIAGDLQVSVKTVSTYKTRIQQKLDCNGIAALVHYAREHDLLDE